MLTLLKPKSLIARLNLSLASLLIVAGLLAANFSLNYLDQELRQHTYLSLEEEATRLLASLTSRLDDEDEEALFALLPSAANPAANGLINQELLEANLSQLPNQYLQPFSGKYFLLQLEANHLTLRSPSLWDFDFNPSNSANSKNPLLNLISGPNQQQLIVFTGYYLYNDQPLNLSLASDYAPIIVKFNQLKKLGLLLGVSLLLLLLVAQSWLIRLSLKPLTAAKNQLKQLEEGQLDQLSPSQIKELQPLIAQINQLLTWQNQQLTKSRSALGNLGHALKTPLAVAFSLANRQEVQALPEIHTSLNQQLTSLNERISQELTRARLVSSGRVGVKFNPAVEVPKLVQLMQQVHGQRLTINYQLAEDLILNYDRDDLLEMLGNLLDNACKWAANQVVIHLALAEKPNLKKYYLITVEDDGAGLSSAEIQQITTAGTRLDEQIQGHGLGLAIVKQLVKAHQGRLAFYPSGLGGLKAAISLPFL